VEENRKVKTADECDRLLGCLAARGGRLFCWRFPSAYHSFTAACYEQHSAGYLWFASALAAAFLRRTASLAIWLYASIPKSASRLA